VVDSFFEGEGRRGKTSRIIVTSNEGSKKVLVSLTI
jgi:hypothetical protein